MIILGFAFFMGIASTKAQEIDTSMYQPNLCSTIEQSYSKIEAELEKEGFYPSQGYFKWYIPKIPTNNPDTLSKKDFKRIYTTIPLPGENKVITVEYAGNEVDSLLNEYYAVIGEKGMNYPLKLHSDCWTLFITEELATKYAKYLETPYDGDFNENDSPRQIRKKLRKGLIEENPFYYRVKMHVVGGSTPKN